jgi:hypothetical protein
MVGAVAFQVAAILNKQPDKGASLHTSMAISFTSECFFGTVSSSVIRW